MVVANGIVSGSGYNPAPGFDLDVFAMGHEEASTAGNTDLLIHHGSTDAPTVDVVEVGAGAGTILDNASYGDFGADYLELATADYAIEVRDETGTVTVAAYEVPLATLGLQDAALVAIASGFLDPSQNSDGPAFGIWVALPSGGPMVQLPTSTARLQVIHNSADIFVEQVDVYLNGGLLLDNFTFRTATPFIDAAAGVTLNIGIAPASSTGPDDVLIEFPVALERNESYIAIANGILSVAGYSPNQPFGLDVFATAREIALDPSNVDVLVYHGSTDAPTVDVVDQPSGITLVDDISYSEFQGYLETATDDYTIEVRDASGENVVASYIAPLDAAGLGGQAITVLASGFLNPANNSDGAAFGLWVALANGGDLIPLEVGTLGLTSNEINGLSLFPNPSTDFITLQGFDGGTYTIDIVDIQGRIVGSSSISETKGTIDVKGLKSGIYQLLFSQNGTILGSKKIIRK